jgi:hypothetical protein
MVCFIVCEWGTERSISELGFDTRHLNKNTRTLSLYDGLFRRPRVVKITLILATSISDITSQYGCVTHLHSNLEYATGKLRSFLPRGFDSFLIAKQVEFKITDSVYQGKLVTIQTTIVIVILFFTSVSERRLQLKRRSTQNFSLKVAFWLPPCLK